MRGTIFTLTGRDLRARYFGSVLGVIWAFVQPMVTIVLFWFIFDVGFKSRPVEGVPFSLWLVSGILPWFFFNDALQAATTAITESPFLVKKVVFRVSVLPVVKLLSALAVHLVLLVFMVGMFWVKGHSPEPSHLQVFYYLAGLLVLTQGLAWLTSALMVFLRDVGQAVAVILQLLFWLTPILWSLDLLPAAYRLWFTYNPLYYVVEGYRSAYIHHRWFWADPAAAAVFWGVSMVVFCCGALVFNRLRPHFADVL